MPYILEQGQDSLLLSGNNMQFFAGCLLAFHLRHSGLKDCHHLPDAWISSDAGTLPIALQLLSSAQVLDAFLPANPASCIAALMHEHTGAVQHLLCITSVDVLQLKHHTAA